MSHAPGEPLDAFARHHTSPTQSARRTMSSNHRRGPSQKAMLSKALQKANQAVVLDNARNVEGAKEAYKEACTLLLQVMSRSSGPDDRKKLEAIRDTYTSRIAELEQINLDHEEDKALPARPESMDYIDDSSPVADEEDTAVIGMAVVTRIVNHDSYVPNGQPPRSTFHIQPNQVPRRRESLMPSPFESSESGFSGMKHSNLIADQYQPRSTSRQDRPTHLAVHDRLSPPLQRQSMMVQPLSPRRAPSPNTQFAATATKAPEIEHLKVEAAESDRNNHRRTLSAELVSWFDTIDESGGSETSSVHSRTSSLKVRRKHIRAASGATEAEFDAALDAAVEAAYDDGFEPVTEPMASSASEEPPRHRLGTALDDYDDRQLSIQAKLEKARERIREAERETAILQARERERERRAREMGGLYAPQQSETDDYDNDSEEEERMLDEMTRGYVMDDFDFGVQSKSALPRESDSSGYSGSTWHNSLTSNTTNGGSLMSTITEHSPTSKANQGSFRPLSTLHQSPSEQLPPPSTAAPKPPQFSRPLTAVLGDSSPAQETVRSRRLSGQKQLKIETSSKASSATESPVVSRPVTSSGPTPIMESVAEDMPPPPLPKPDANQLTRMRTTSESAPSGDITSPTTPSRTHTSNLTETGDSNSRSGSPGRAQSRTGVRKNHSSSSLKNMKSRNPSISKIDESSDVVSDAPLAQFATRDTSKLPAMPSLPTPLATAFSSKINMPSGGLYLFDNDIHYPQSPSSETSSADIPVPLEPCPTEFILRPFWFMRALYQTLVHKKGGYISNKLFIPQDVWKVKNVKIKGLEEKISSCDFLTAALQKLSQVDTCDADAVLEEMQAFEDVLEQVRATLVKKIGSEVGVHTSGGGLFRDAPPATDAETSNTGGSKTTSLPSKTSSFSWRRLRSKSSGLALNSYVRHTPAAGHAEGGKDTLTMSTLPMTTLTNVRFTKRNVREATFTGPNAAYMSSLAKLFDGAQVLDQIARQVEDPGLKHADKTQVGLELSTRHAAEFFGFYICRFVLTDVTLLLDKYIKRGSEWVLI